MGVLSGRVKATSTRTQAWPLDGYWGANPGANGGVDARNKRPPIEFTAANQVEGLVSPDCECAKATSDAPPGSLEQPHPPPGSLRFLS